MRPFFICRQPFFPSVPDSVRTGGPVVGLDSTRNFLLRSKAMGKLKKRRLTKVARVIRHSPRPVGGRGWRISLFTT